MLIHSLTLPITIVRYSAVLKLMDLLVVNYIELAELSFQMY